MNLDLYTLHIIWTELNVNTILDMEQFPPTPHEIIIKNIFLLHKAATN